MGPVVTFTEYLVVAAVIFGLTFWLATIMGDANREFEQKCAKVGGHVRYFVEERDLCLSADGRILEP
jgi:hypothetical protein